MSVKTFKRGESIFKEGDKITSLLIVQSGGVGLCLQRKKMIDLLQVGSNQILGEGAFANMAAHSYAAIATAETKILEIPIDQVRAVVDGGNQAVKIIVKSMADRLKFTLADLKTHRLEKDASPCPDDQVANIFGGVFHTLNHKADRDPKNANNLTIDWLLLKNYCQRIFGVTPKKVEQVLNVLVKFKCATLEMGKSPEDPDGPEELQKIHATNITQLEGFFEFWQYNYFRNGRSDVLKVDDALSMYLSALIKIGETLPLDRFGVVEIELSKAIELVKADLGLALTSDIFTRLEARGVFVKRAPKTDGTVFLHFEIKEFKHIATCWKFIREVERWNERGFVDPKEEVTAPKRKATDGPSCPQCSVGIPQAAKFCPECGYKLVADKAS